MEKIRIKRRLNETYGMSFVGPSGSNGSTSSNGMPYCEYRILPLLHNLEQKGNSSNINLKKNNRLYLGEHVYGICTYDDKVHHGVIQRFYREEGSLKISLIYILDQNSQVVPLYPNSIKKNKIN